MTSLEAVRFSRRTLLHGVSKYINLKVNRSRSVSSIRAATFNPHPRNFDRIKYVNKSFFRRYQHCLKECK
jgi:hypothetical protein